MIVVANSLALSTHYVTFSRGTALDQLCNVSDRLFPINEMTPFSVVRFLNWCAKKINLVYCTLAFLEAKCSWETIASGESAHLPHFFIHISVPSVYYSYFLFHHLPTRSPSLALAPSKCISNVVLHRTS